MGHVRICFRVGTRRTCRVLALHRSMYLYQSRRPEQALLRKRIREIVETRVRYGYRQVHILLQREGWPSALRAVCNSVSSSADLLLHARPGVLLVVKGIDCVRKSAWRPDGELRRDEPAARLNVDLHCT